jgi:hypothetical protein
MDNSSKERLAIYRRALECPKGDNPIECPLHILRLLPVDDRFSFLRGLDEASIHKLYEFHRECLENGNTSAREKVPDLADKLPRLMKNG